MRISSYAIDHPRFVSIATLLVILTATWVTMTIPIQRTPALTKAVVLVAIPYPDAAPEEAELEIAKKVEDALTDLKRVDFISSTSLRGSSVTMVIFLDGVDPDDARREVKDLVDRIRPELPVGREVQPTVVDIDFESEPLMLVTLSGPPGYDDRSLKQITEDVQKELETVDGVANTQIYGGQEREIHVNINPDLMAQYGLTIGEIRQAIVDSHAEIPAGRTNTGQFDRQVRSEAKLRGIRDVREAIVSSKAGRAIHVHDVADVIDSHRRRLSVALLDGKKCATIIVNKESDINTLGAAEAVKTKVEELKQAFPFITFSTTRDTSEEIQVMFRVLGSSALFGAMLVLVILAWSMGLRVSVLVLMAIPFSAAVAMVFLYSVAIPLSNMVVFSFILVLGMVVDGAIIVAENIHRHVERGEDPIIAAKVGIDEVGLPVIAADLTTIAAFLPMLWVPGIMGDFLGVMPKVVSVALLGSVMVDHFLIPTLAARWYRRRDTKKPNGDSGVLELNPSPPPPSSGGAVAIPSPLPPSSGEGLGVGVGAFEPTRPISARLPDSSESRRRGRRMRSQYGPLTELYRRILQFSLNHRFFVIVWCGILLWGAALLVPHIGFEFFPPSDRGQFSIRYELPLGYSIEETLAVGKEIARPLEAYREDGVIVHYVTAIGSASALASRLGSSQAMGPEFGEIMVQLLSPLDRDVHEEQIIDELRKQVHAPPGVKVSFHQVEEGPPGGHAVAIRLTGKKLENLGRLAQMIEKRMNAIGGAVDVATTYRDFSPELVIEPKPDILAMFDLKDRQVARAIQTAIAGDTTIQITLDDEDVTVRVQLAPEYQRHLGDLKRLLITSPTGRRATIGQLADIRRDAGLYSVNRYNRNREVVAYCDVIEPVSPADVFEVLAEEILPELGFEPADDAEKTLEGFAKTFIGTTASVSEGIQAEFTGENDERDKNFFYLLLSMTIAIGLIFAILVAQFNSLRQAVVVMVTVPLSFVGVALGMWLCGFPFSLASFIGLVSLTGIVVNDAIVMVDFANQSRKRGLPLREALLEAGVNRLRPVLLTTVTTIGGLLPLFLNISGGAEFWQPLTGAVVFGLGFASVLTLVVIPVCYSIAYSVRLPFRSG